MRCLLLFFLSLILPSFSMSAPVKIKNLVSIDGVRGNDLVGYGLVVGLNGTGDSLRNSPFTEEILTSLLDRLGINVTEDNVRSKNIAAVIATATLPPFARTGSQIGVTVSAIGDAKSLLGGTLVLTPLNGADGEIYAIAQGSILSGGAEASASSSQVILGVPTSGFLPSGARVEREVNFEFSKLESIRLALIQPDFTTATRIEMAINKELGSKLAELIDPGTIVVDTRSLEIKNPTHLISRIENIGVEPELKARVVVDHRSGTIVLGGDVKVSQIAISQGNISIRIQEAAEAFQPNPFSEGETIIVPRSRAELRNETGIGLTEISDAPSLSAVVSGLNSLGVKPRDLVDILKSVHASGALHAELLVY